MGGGPRRAGARAAHPLGDTWLSGAWPPPSPHSDLGGRAVPSGGLPDLPSPRSSRLPGASTHRPDGFLQSAAPSTITRFISALAQGGLPAADREFHEGP